MVMKSLESAGEVVVDKELVVTPATPTARHLIPLSGFELKMLAIPHFHQIFFYRAERDGADSVEEVVERLRSSLSAALVEYYPLAGRLHTAPDGTVSVDCNDAGVPMLLASTHTTLAELGEALEPTPWFASLVPQSALPPTSPLLPPLSVQVTQFACGSLALAAAGSHVIADGTAMVHFLACWSELARGAAHPSVRAVHQRFYLDAPAPPPPVRPAAAAAAMAAAAAAMDWAKFLPPVAMKQPRFHVSPAQLQQLKRQAAAPGHERLDDHDDTTISSYQALCAHTWVAVTRARRLAPDTPVRYYFSVDCRRRLRPALPAGYFGAALLTVHAAATAGELLAGGAPYAAALLNRAVRQLDDAAVRARLRQDQAAGYPTLLAGFVPGLHLGSASYPKFPLYQAADFGWGQPLAARNGRDSSYLDGVLYFDPSAVPGAVDISMSLYPDTIRRLLDDPDFVPTPAFADDSASSPSSSPGPSSNSSSAFSSASSSP